MVDNRYTICGTNISYPDTDYRKAIDGIIKIKDSVKSDKRMMMSMEDLVNNIKKAYEAIYSPLIDSHKLDIVKSTLNDYHTDLDKLANLVDLFK
jgi:hypothetical protein